ncbi:MAG: hypothetical protein V3U45_04865 [bacterium]
MTPHALPRRPQDPLPPSEVLRRAKPFIREKHLTAEEAVYTVADMDDTLFDETMGFIYAAQSWEILSRRHEEDIDRAIALAEAEEKEAP